MNSNSFDYFHSTTDDGESIIPVVLAKTAIDFLAGDRHPDEAAQMVIDTLKSKVTGEAGCILIDPQWRVGWAHNSSDMACAYMTIHMKNQLYSQRKTNIVKRFTQRQRNATVIVSSI